jgi:ketosteroid isomerase-like protein
MSTETNRATALQFLQLMSDLDFKPMFELMSEDAVWTVAGRAETFPQAGPQPKHIRAEMFDAFISVFRSLRFNIVSTTAEANRVVVEFTARGEAHGGQVYENEFLSLFTFRDGKIVGVYEHCDQQSVFAFERSLQTS